MRYADCYKSKSGGQDFGHLNQRSAARNVPETIRYSGINQSNGRTQTRKPLSVPHPRAARQHNCPLVRKNIQLCHLTSTLNSFLAWIVNKHTTLNTSAFDRDSGTSPFRPRYALAHWLDVKARRCSMNECFATEGTKCRRTRLIHYQVMQLTSHCILHGFQSTLKGE